MSLAKIESALIQAYEEAALGLPTAYENRGFDPPNDAPWAALYVLPNQPDVVTLGNGGEDDHTGVLQIDLRYPLNAGNGAAVAMADLIRDVYEAGVDLTYEDQVVVITGCGRSSGARELGMYKIIISITWYARTHRKIGV